ncbi:prepilin-type N-terminal cleavage/methylation domain-containing protein [Tateyamaria sp. syn59]|uniref:prepilin-type N-terminal cleavage/methylation domain-containing protein n=1 Tax=Tateyamaria sp. syn59 TaxID=2576942 RepID=UPI0011BF4FDE|nr:prepilin-type N-terminal cleavage/methylation domain-containing protein [Tateyamaria sp. syn59]
MTATRVRTAGVSLIEMLVVLALFGVVAGAVVMSVPSGARATSTDAAARALAAHLDHAVDHTLITGQGFGIVRDGKDIRFVQRGPNATWVAHSDKRLGQMKLSAAPSRISIKEAEVYAVSAQLIPNSAIPLRVDFGRGNSLETVLFDGVGVHRQPGS